MKTAVFIVPFDPVTKTTDVPTPEWVHKTPEQGETVIAQVRGTDAVIEAMKLDSESPDPTYKWLEDVEVPDGEI